MISYILAIVTGVVVLGVDQFTKYYIVSNYIPGEGSKFIKGIIGIFYTTNKGGAWGILNGYTWTLLAITTILMVVCFTLLVKMGKRNKFVFWSISLILFGGLGNMIDRIFRNGEVVDFLQFEFYPEFPYSTWPIALLLWVDLCLWHILSTTAIKSRNKRKSEL